MPRSNNPTPRVLSWAVRLYRPTLRFFPSHFRSTYGPQMEQLFRDLCYDAYQAGGAGALVRLWFTSLFEVGVNAMAEHLNMESAPGSKPARQGIRVGLGLGLVLALCIAAMDLLTLDPTFNNLLLGCFYSATLVLLALAGVRGARAGGRIVDGLAAGVVAGLCAALMLDGTVIIMSTFFTDLLRQHPGEVSGFISSGEADFRAYELEDALGGCFYMFLFGLPLGAALGALGGLLGKTGAGRLARS